MIKIILDNNKSELKLTDEQANKLCKIKEFIKSQFSTNEIVMIRIETDEKCSCEYPYDENSEIDIYCSCYFAGSHCCEFCGCCHPIVDDGR